jgi:four helix bundle protein
MQSYTDLEIYTLAYALALEVHQMSLTLPKYELYEQGSQIRRSSKSIKDNIAEGFGRRKYKKEYVRFLTFAQASCDETLSQLNMINDIHFQANPNDQLIREYQILGKKINLFIQSVEKHWKSPK